MSAGKQHEANAEALASITTTRHTMTGWTSSTRRSRLPRDWPQRRATVKARAQGLCQAGTHAPGCTGIGNECDHIISGDDHRLSNLQWLSTECHKAKTRQEARAEYVRRKDRRRTKAQPPGLKIN